MKIADLEATHLSMILLLEMSHLLSLNLLIFIIFGSAVLLTSAHLRSYLLNSIQIVFKDMGILIDILMSIISLCGSHERDAYSSYGGCNYAEPALPNFSQVYGTNHGSVKSYRTAASSVYSSYHGSVTPSFKSNISTASWWAMETPESAYMEGTGWERPVFPGRRTMGCEALY